VIAGTTVAALVRSAAKLRANSVIEREHRMTTSVIDSAGFARAINKSFRPNAALRKAIAAAAKVKRAGRTAASASSKFR
jgi:uncharacterized protein (DUF1778 family)